MTKVSYLGVYSVLALNTEKFIDDVPDSLEQIELRNDQEEWGSTIQEELR